MPSWFDFLRIEADLAMTFIKVARTVTPQNAARSRGRARTALAEIQHALRIRRDRGLDEGDIVFLKQRCKKIELALADVED